VSGSTVSPDVDETVGEVRIGSRKVAARRKLAESYLSLAAALELAQLAEIGDPAVAELTSVN